MRSTPRTLSVAAFRTLVCRPLRLVLAMLPLLVLFGLGSAAAQPRAEAKFARDLAAQMDPAARPSERWARDVRGQRELEVIVVGDGVDPEMTELRAQVQRLGGTVLVRHPALHALTVRIGAGPLQALARRADVASVSPNRTVQRSASTLEAITGAATPGVRGGPMLGGLDGSGVGIAVLDSGIMKAHRSFANAVGAPRVRRSVDMLKARGAIWTDGLYDGAMSYKPGATGIAKYENLVANDANVLHDPYGHGTHVASVAAGRGAYQMPDTTGVAPNADLYDVRVLDADGVGTMSDVIEGIQWVIYHAREYNIRVMNLSLAASSSESWRTDPLCRAVRSAVAAGITVVVAAGNFGRAADGREAYGAVSAPGHDPSVITVGAVNYRNTLARHDDSVNFFSSRGPTRGAWTDAVGTRHVDNLLKPDLVAPGNRIVGAAATQALPYAPTWNRLASAHPELVHAVGLPYQYYTWTLMMMSGTSVAAPAVSGTVALMLQANPGLTPPLVKAMLQYSAQPLAQANLLQQGAGLLNVPGAVALARALRTDLAPAIEAGRIAPGAPMLRSGAALPPAASSIAGQTFGWSRLMFAGGNRIIGGAALFAAYQPIYDPRLTWANGSVRRREAQYWPATTTTPGNTFVRSFSETTLANQRLLTAAVVDAGTLLGAGSPSGPLTPTATLSGWLASGSGVVMSEGIVISEGVVMSEGLVLSEGLLLSEGLVLSEGLLLSEGLTMSEGLVISENLRFDPALGTFTLTRGEP